MAWIKEDCIERIKAAVDLVKIAEHYTKLKCTGACYQGISPFSNEKTGSFTVWPATQTWKDFSGGGHGDAVTLLMLADKLTYEEAIIELGKRCNIEVEFDDSDYGKKKAEKEKQRNELRPVLQLALKNYSEALFALPRDHEAWKEIFKRGYSEDEANSLQLGYAPGGRFFYEKIKGQEDKIQAAKELFLLDVKLRDKYFHRVMYPLRDKNGLICGFAGRATSGDPKWLNPSDTPLYQKSNFIYGLDQAVRNIHKFGKFIVVEGYNDVIAFQRAGMPVAVAASGTNISEAQLNIIQRFSKRIVLCLDPDKAGIQSTKKHIPILIEKGFSVQLLQLHLDPDEFFRPWFNYFGAVDGSDALHHDILTDALIWYANERLDESKDVIDKGEARQEIILLISKIGDEQTREIYSAELAKKLGTTPAQLAKKATELQTNKTTSKRERNTEYQLPRKLTDKGVKLDDVIDDIRKYGVFMAANRIWHIQGDGALYTFKHISNFEIEVIQHMNDDQYPKKLIRAKNVRGEEAIFDVPSEDLTTPQKFDKALSDRGNFFYNGGRNELQKLRPLLYDKMGVGEKIEVLGWQPDGFWVFNNAVIVPGEGKKLIDERGIYKNDKHSYYIPSANKIYRNDPQSFLAQKKFLFSDPQVSFTEFTKQMVLVHREHAMVALLFTIASMFQDIVEDKLDNFPILFLFGPASTGKDQLVNCCQSFFGEPQTPIHMGNKTSTAKAQVRKFAQFANAIVHLSEFKRGDERVEEMLKGFWDRVGYEIGTLESKISTHTIPILQSVILTGNDYPDTEALITRLLAEEVVKTDFTKEDKDNYRKLNKMQKKGISGITAELLQHRSLWADHFLTKFHQMENEVKSELALHVINDRMISNISVIMATYELMKDKLTFPFNYQQLMDHLKASAKLQVMKINTGGIINKFFKLLLSCVRTKQDPLQQHREIHVTGDRLSLQFSQVYMRVARQWYLQFSEGAPSYQKLLDYIKADETLFIENKNSHYFGTTEGTKNKTSAIVVNLQATGIADELMNTLSWVEEDNRRFGGGASSNSDSSSPATPKMFDDDAPY